MTPAERNRWTLIIAGLFLAGLAAAWMVWFFEHYERRQRTVRGELSAEARRNPYLAAGRYLSRIGFEVDSIRGRTHLKSPPPRPGTLIVHDAGPSLPAGDEARLLDWVAQGGHLVLVPRRAAETDTVSARNRLYHRFGVRLVPRRKQPEDGDAPEPDVVVGLDSDESGPFRVAFDGGRYLEDTEPAADRALTGEHGPHMLAYEHGAGRVTVFSDNGFMLNDRLGDHDHAWFLSDLLKRHDSVWFLTNAAMPPLTAMMWRYAPEAALAAILLGLLGLWRAAVTHGPRLETPPRVRRDLGEHLEAAADFAWRRDPDRALMQRARSVVEKQWRRRHPQLNRMDEAARCAWIAARTGLGEDAVRRALYSAAGSEETLIRDSRVQQRLVLFLGQRTDLDEERT